MTKQDKDGPSLPADVEKNLKSVRERTSAFIVGPLGRRRIQATTNDEAANIKHKHATKSSRLWRKVKKGLLGNAASGY
ncbi:MAG TPA: hypothetical protein VEW42_05410 [Candidatus Eisenbacteria bacterium]|nr:hypothetical protein [Candidatus Eisenbacteria bacterium]